MDNLGAEKGIYQIENKEKNMNMIICISTDKLLVYLRR